MIFKTIGYSYDDLSIIPDTISTIKSRSEIKIDSFNIFTAPMSTVVNENNLDLWIKNKIIPIIPRNISLEKRTEYIKKGYWVAIGLKEAEDLFIKEKIDISENIRYNICIDIANGHMEYLYDLCYNIKKNFFDLGYINNISIMTGNIANPDTYEYLCGINKCHFFELNKCNIVDYIRVSIGSGSGCLTSSNLGIHYPIASLIDKCYQLKYGFGDFCCPKIIADGGIKNYDNIIKAFALGADYVMIGGLFAGFFESAAEFVDENECYYAKKDNASENAKRECIEYKQPYKKFYGMSTKYAQKLIGKSNKTSEGKLKNIKVKYTIKQWSDNMDSYLRSALSYCGCHSLEEFIGNINLIVNSAAEQNAINK